MKKLFVLFILTLTVAVVSCQDQKNDAEEQRLQSIAQNSFYKSYLASLRDIQLGIARGDFDLSSITPIIIKNQNVTICNIPAEEFSGVYGGSRYQELLCKVHNESLKLKNNLPDYFKLDKDQLQKVSQIHDATEGINWTKTIEKALSNRN